MITEQTIINCNQIKGILRFHSSKIAEICDFFIVDICLLTSLEHNARISNPSFICNTV